MKKLCLHLLAVSGLCLSVIACGGGGSSSSNNSNNGGGGGGGNEGESSYDYPTPATPTPTSGSYNGVAYSNISSPANLPSYPQAYQPNNLQIAYGNSDESSVANLTAYVTLDGSLCSATPVKYDQKSNTTFLISAAHCFMYNKTNATTLTRVNLLIPSQLKVYHGVSKTKGFTAYSVKAVYLRQDYCYGSTFTLDQTCPNFTPTDGATNGQGNDIAIIQVDGQYADPSVYPQVVDSSEYPKANTMAPVLSIGYGLNTQQPSTSNALGRSEMFYVTNYFYLQHDSTSLNTGGYHYIYNSFYNNGGFGSKGYTALVCGGDSGGGDLFWTGSKWILLSEHTYGPSNSCGNFYSYLPNAATNVSAYYDWIQSIFNDSDPVNNCKNGSIANCVTNG